MVALRLDLLGETAFRGEGDFADAVLFIGFLPTRIVISRCQYSEKSHYRKRVPPAFGLIPAIGTGSSRGQ
jgi:hypothetical protein